MKIVMGTMTFAGQVDEENTKAILNLFAGSGGVELDTAHQYQDGETEALLGKLLAGGDPRFALATKANPWNDEGLKPAQVKKQFAESAARLRRRDVDLFYLHSPDLHTPVEDTLAACFEIYQAGGFQRFGLSNFASWQVAEAVEKCRSNGWMVPTVYQGVYNALNRDIERELMPCLRNYGISFYAYNPLAGGLLTGKHQRFEDQPHEGRFDNNPQYMERYWKRDYFQSLEVFKDRCRGRNVEPAATALAWMVNHSALSAQHGDAIILGASNPGQLQANIRALGIGMLADDVINALDAGWEMVRPNCFKYFRP